MAKKLKQLLTQNSGVAAIEYALVASLIAVAAVAGFTALGGKQEQQFNNVNNKL